MASKVRVFRLRTQKEEELQKGLGELKTELSQLRIAKIAGGTASKLGKIGLVRKRIAKYLTVINQQKRAQIRDSLKKKGPKALPLDMRAKKTRAIRRVLSKTHRSQKTQRQFKAELNFPVRRFALKK